MFTRNFHIIILHLSHILRLDSQATNITCSTADGCFINFKEFLDELGLIHFGAHLSAFGVVLILLRMCHGLLTFFSSSVFHCHSACKGLGLHYFRASGSGNSICFKRLKPSGALFKCHQNAR